MLKNTFHKTDLERSEIINIPVDEIIERKFKIRRTHYDIDSLAKSISLFGVLQPLLVRNTQRGFELVCGERRLLAARLAGLDSVPCTVSEFSDSMAVAAAMIENIQRREMYFLDVSECLKSISDIFLFSDNKLAILFGISLDHISNAFKYLELDKFERDSFRASGLTEYHADILLDSPSEMRSELLKYTEEHRLSPVEMYMHLENEIREEYDKRSYARRSKPLSDLRLFFNSIEKAVKIIKLAGVDVETDKSEDQECIEYRIRIKK